MSTVIVVPLLANGVPNESKVKLIIALELSWTWQGSAKTEKLVVALQSAAAAGSNSSSFGKVNLRSAPAGVSTLRVTDKTYLDETETTELVLSAYAYEKSEGQAWTV